MTPFEIAVPLPRDPEQLARDAGIGLQEAKDQIERLMKATVLKNDEYQVLVQRMTAPFGRGLGDMWYLSIRRLDRDPIHDWRALQTIKNMVCGEEAEGFELYPAESRLVDTSNQYHLWVFIDKTVRLPVGYKDRMVATPEEAALFGAKQREFKE